MATFAKTFNSEIQRVARRAMRPELTALKQAGAAHRKEISQLKLQVRALTALIKGIKAAPVLTNGVAGDAPAPQGKRLPFGPAKLVATRTRFGMTQAQMALLVDASALSYFKWEKNLAVPHKRNLVKIAEVMTLGKREAWKRLAAHGMPEGGSASVPALPYVPEPS